MNSRSFGFPSWNLLHQLPWLFPSELFNEEDTIIAIRFSHDFVQMLPCKYCRESGGNFEAELNLIRSITVQIASGSRRVLRSRWVKYWYDFHNRVNEKLLKPRFGLSWKDTIRQRDDWMFSLWEFIFITCWNYPVEDPDPAIVLKYDMFFRITLPTALRHTAMGKYINSYINDEVPLTEETLRSRVMLCRWSYNLRRKCTPCCLGENPWPYMDLHALMECFRAKKLACIVDTGLTTSTTQNDAMKPTTCM